MIEAQNPQEHKPNDAHRDPLDAGNDHTDDPSQDADFANTEDVVWLGDDLERAYQQALDVANAVEWQTGKQNTQADESGKPKAESGVNSSVFGSPRVTPKQVIEAALFVGGVPLTIKKLCSLLRGDFDQDFVESTIEELNRQYGSENRPYEICFGKGGYRLALRPEFERVRNRVFGLGPKEVKLSQEALEVLALVAYRQPISVSAIEACGKENASGVLRQLLRRELIAIERGENRSQQITYHTTPRFLQLFGLGHIDELPQAEELSFK